MLSPRRLLQLFVINLLPWLCLQAQTALPAGESLVGGNLLLSNFQSSASTSATGNYTVSSVSSSGPGFTQATRVATTQDLSPSYAVEIHLPTTRDVAKGDVAIIRFFARATLTTEETGTGSLRVVIQKNSGSYDKSLETQATIGSSWQEYFVPFEFAAAYSAGQAELAFGFGFKKQTLEIGGVEVIYYGKTRTVASLPVTKPSYPGRDADAAWRKDALARIESIRKGNFSVRVVDAAGQPVPDAKVHVEMTRSAFEFGTAIQPQRLLSTAADDLKYQSILLEFFNAGTTENHLKWQPWIGEWGYSYSRTITLAGLRWLKDRNISTRGHVLVWPGWSNLPNLIVNLKGTASESTIPQLVKDHITEELTATKDLLVDWDVLNEPYKNHDLMDLFGQSIMVDWFTTARSAAPTLRLYLNDYSNHDKTTDADHVQSFTATAQYLLSKGAPLGGLGLQAHIGASPNAPVNVLSTLNDYSALKLPIRITEFDIKTSDEDLRADYTRDFMILCYSHPSIVGFQFWGFWDSAHWIANGGMFSADWTEKPAAKVYRSLVLDQWRTRLDGTTDSQGAYASRGFYGSYQLKVETGGKSYQQTFDLSEGQAAPSIQVQVTSSVTPLVIPPGGSTTLQAGSSGTSYQWSKDGTAIAGATGSSLALARLRETDAGTYSVAITTASGIVQKYYRLYVGESRLLGLSVRAVSRAKTTPLIVGLIVSGGPQTILFRSAGLFLKQLDPGLNAANLLQDPFLELHQTVDGKDTIPASNDDWQSSDAAGLRAAFTASYLSPWDGYPKEAALLQSIEGLRTAFVYDTQGRSGVTLCEMYDTKKSSGRLQAISVRNYAGSGDNTLIAGFIIEGNVPKKLLIRAIGPSLPHDQVPNYMPNPKLDLYQIVSGNSSIIASNDDWGTDNSAGLLAAMNSISMGAPTSGSKDAMLLVTLDPGVYTANVTGSDGSPGEALVEVYEVP